MTFELPWCRGGGKRAEPIALLSNVARCPWCGLQVGLNAAGRLEKHCR